jgi:hypothetical protein
MSVLTLYHGSNVVFDDVSLAKSRDRRDFGRGFYMTTIREQAGQWAKSLFERYQGSGKYLYVFGFGFDESLSVKEFEGLTLEWLDFVKDNRIFGGTNHDFDVVKGPVANDNTMPTIALYVDGTLGAEATLAQLAYYKANDQVSIHTERALKRLALIERIEL